MDPPLCEALTADTGAKSSLRSWRASWRSVSRMSSKPLLVKGNGGRLQANAAGGRTSGRGMEDCNPHTERSFDERRAADTAGRGDPRVGCRVDRWPGGAAGSRTREVQRRPWATRCRRKEVCEGAVPGQAVDPDASRDKAEAARLALGSTKIKISTVPDQDRQPEIQPLHHNDTRKINTNDGEDTTEGEETTGEQLSALPFRPRGGEAPFVEQQQRAIRSFRPLTAVPARAVPDMSHLV